MNSWAQVKEREWAGFRLLLWQHGRHGFQFHDSPFAHLRVNVDSGPQAHGDTLIEGQHDMANLVYSGAPIVVIVNPLVNCPASTGQPISVGNIRSLYLQTWN